MESTSAFKKNDPKVIRGWVWYDWANSAYSLTIATAVFPIFFVKMVPKNLTVFGLSVTNSALYSYAVSFAFLMVALISPILSGIADYKDNKKGFMKFFVYLGSIACISLAFFSDTTSVWVGIVPFVIATLAFAGSLVFYNAYLHQIVTPDRMDKVSARGFSMGYIGSVILLVINLVVIMFPEGFGLPKDGPLPSQIAFITVGLWWAGFSQISFRLLPKQNNPHPYSQRLLLQGYRELQKVWQQLKQTQSLKKFLLSFFVYSMGLQTVMYVASVFGEEVIKLETTQLIITILLIQLVAIGGAVLFSRISSNFGNIFSITVALIIWVLVCIGAYLLPEKEYTGFYLLGSAVGLVMGGVQAISRSTYAKLVPKDTPDHASFFSFYDVTEKLSIVIGTFVWGLIDNLVDMRSGILGLIVFFAIGLLMLQGVNDKRLKPAA